MGILNVGRLLASASALFTPLSLFSLGEVGAWYDPSDFNTMYQDSAGTTPVTAVEQPVGKILDKSGRGNHASQSTPASRPVLSARYNLLTRTEEFDNAYWSKSGATVSKNATGPDGVANSAFTLTASSTATYTGVYNAISVPAGSTLLVHAKAGNVNYLGLNTNTSNWASFNLSDGTVANSANGTASITSLGNGWYRCAITNTSVADTYFIMSVKETTGAANAWGNRNTTSGSYIYIWGADLRVTNDGIGLPAYQRVVDSTTYDAGDQWPKFLKFDGTDDSLATSSIDFSGTDKLGLVSGIRKLNDTAVGVVAELSATIASNSGTFLLAAPGSANLGRLDWSSKGTVKADVSPAGLDTPLTVVATGTGDISGDTAILRLNGVARPTVTTDQGSGNYGNYALNIGRRGGSTLPYNGRLYSLVIVGRALSATEITNAETWVNTKTRAF